MCAVASVKKAANTLRKHKELAAPAIISATLTIAVIVAFLFLTGIYHVSTELIALEAEWEQTGLPIEFIEYLELQGYDLEQELTALVTWTNFWLLIGLLIFKLVTAWYLGCMAWAMIARIHKHSKESVWKTTNKYFLRYSILHIIVLFIIYLPVIFFVYAGLYMLLAAGNAVLALGAMTIVAILLAIYLLGAIMRLIFVAPSLFDKNKGTVKTLGHAYHITAHHLQHVLVVTLIAIALAIVASQTGGPTQQAIGHALFSINTVTVILASLAIGMFVLIEATIVTYERIFLYEAYHEHINMK